MTTSTDDIDREAPPVTLTLETIARALQCSPRTVRRLVNRGAFPAPVRVGSKLKRWIKQDVDQWFATANKTEGATSATV